MSFVFKAVGRPANIPYKQWNDWKWQLRHVKKAFTQSQLFMAGASPYYLRLIEQNPILKPIVQPTNREKAPALQQMEDPLGEEKHSPLPRLIHRYPDRVLLLTTDQCAVYCRYCTRKRFTGKQKSFIPLQEREKALSYIKRNKGIREVILSGGDPLSLSDKLLDQLLQSLRAIRHIEILRIASRMPVACPMRLTNSLIKVLKKYQPVFLMSHFNHPLELSFEAKTALTRMVDSGILIFNQTVLLNKINNHPAIIQALMRRLIYLRVKPYYMFQCDPSEGSDGFRTSISNSLKIQKELWGRFSGLALPPLSVDIPGGGGKVGLTPDFISQKGDKEWRFKGWDGLESAYINPPMGDFEDNFKQPALKAYKKEWEIIKNQSYGAKKL